MRPVMRAAAAFLVLLALPMMFSPAVGQQDAAKDYPNRLVRIVVPFPPGGPADLMARSIADGLRAAWSQPVIVENRPGGNGFIGAEAVARAPADGYTLFVAFFGTLVVNPSLYVKLPYDPMKDFAPITTIATLPLMLVVNPKSPIRSIADLIVQAKARPDTLNFASGGRGQGAHLAGELFKSMAGVSMVHVPYKGNAPAVADVIGGHVDMIFDGMATSLPHVQSGALRAIAVSTIRRASAMPDLPTVAEQGLSGFDVGSWFGILATGGTPPAIVAKLNETIVDILKQPASVKLMVNAGLDPMPSTPSEFTEFMKTETDKWANVIRDARITPE